MADENNGRLVSWKEIAAYLGCDVRTCLRWEKERGLPVHRPGGQPGPRVMAWKHELDQWLTGTSALKPKSEPTAEQAPPTAPAAKRRIIGSRKVLIPAVLAVLGIFAFFGIRALTADREPADFRIDGSLLVIQNKAKKDLWPFDTKLADLSSEAAYRQKFQIRKLDETKGLRFSPMLAIKDIDGDGHKEVLFVPHTDSSENSRTIYCFDHRGKQRWQFDGGKEIVGGNKLFSWDYQTYFETHDINGDGRMEIIVLSEQHTGWPTQLVILSCDRRILGEYWNSGRIIDLVLSDIDDDGYRDLLIGGVNNEYRKAFIAVLDPRHMAGASPNSGNYDWPSLPDGTERAYVLLPWTDIDPVNDVHAILKTIVILDNGRIRSQIFRTNLEFDLDPRTLACLDVTLSGLFKLKHEEAVRAGDTHSTLDDAYCENIKHGLLYWTGRDWTSTPSWVTPKP
ncbi:MAG: FG-GAP-like repeat-containing protein [Acidobacteriota bacterium]|nr:FG-GAP-like repeat-containing protein [Acidobacteriota bacterium]